VLEPRADPVATRRIALGPQRRDGQVQRVQRLAQVVARGGEEARLRRIRGGELAGALLDLA